MRTCHKYKEWHFSINVTFAQVAFERVLYVLNKNFYNLKLVSLKCYFSINK